MRDVVVVGGGPAGGATSIALRLRGVPRVTLIDASSPDAVRIGESIPPDTRLLLSELGLWESFEAEGHDPCHGSCSSWGSDELGYNDFLFNPYGSGFHLDRRRFDEWLVRAAERMGVEVRRSTLVETIERQKEGGFRLKIAQVDDGGGGGFVNARFVVDATGRPARVARQLGASRLLHDLLTFVYGFFPPGSGGEAPSLTMLEAVPYGYWYAARLPEARLVIAVASDPEQLRDDALHRPGVWMERLLATKHIAKLLVPGAALEEPLTVSNAPSARLDCPAGPGWLAVGDAASSFDPLSSQGIHKALQDGLSAARAITAYFNGDGGALDEYVASVGERFDDYVRNRAHFYSTEGRFYEAPFWARRRGETGPPRAAR